MRTRAFVTALAGALLALPLALAGPAQAGQPTHVRFSNEGPGESDTICPFPVMVFSNITVWGIMFDGQPENLNIAHLTETDTFVGPTGNTLVGLQYHLTLHLPDNGPRFAAGVLAVVPLNNGTLFRSTGRVDFNVFTGDFVLTPTTGHSGDVAEFCSELAAP
jgi:hypothetical protein